MGLDNYRMRRNAYSYVAIAVKAGKLPRASTLTCVKCGEQADQYHHYLGYELKNRLKVEPVCEKCNLKERKLTRKFS